MYSRLFDEAENPQRAEFKAAWNGFLRCHNMFQFLPQTQIFTSRGLLAGEISPDALQKENASGPGVKTQDTALSEWLGLTDPMVHELLHELIKRGISLPEPGYELAGQRGEIIATAELAWPALKIAVLKESEKSFESLFASQEWKVLLLDLILREPQTVFELLEPAGH